MVYVPRANASFPSTWLSLRWSPESGDPASLLSVAIESKLPLDLTRNAALWRSGLNEESFVATIGGREAENVKDEESAANLVEAAIFQASCSLGQTIGLFAIDVRSSWSSEQVRGALAAIELARTDGIVKFAGLSCCSAEVLKAVWQDHDGFEFVLMTGDQWTEESSDLCKKRGVASVGLYDVNPPENQPLSAINLVGVRSASDIEEITRQSGGDC